MRTVGRAEVQGHTVGIKATLLARGDLCQFLQFVFDSGLFLAQGDQVADADVLALGQFVEALLLGLQAILATAHIGHRVGQVFGTGDALAEFPAFSGQCDHRLHAARRDAQDERAAMVILGDAQNIAGAETCRLTRLTGSVHTWCKQGARQRQRQLMLIGQLRTGPALFAVDHGGAGVILGRATRQGQAGQQDQKQRFCCAFQMAHGSSFGGAGEMDRD